MASEKKTQNYGKDLEDLAKKMGHDVPEFKFNPPLENAPVTQISQILTGWGNRIKDTFNMVEPKVKVLSEARLKVCDVCPIRRGNKCAPNLQIQHHITGNLVNGCGCNISAKTLSPSSHCPAGKW
jgi:hypothetical protein|tara:strand:- start:4017 stop:4391 length:375 start_codon:yes stop_codon:yes gene_type:complete